MDSLSLCLRQYLIFLPALLLWSGLPALGADYIINGDIKDRLSGWQGDGQVAFLHADGTEGADGDSDVTPVIKLKLSKGQPREVRQEINLSDSPTTMHIKIDVYASADFKRSTFPQDYTQTWTKGTYFWTNIIVPTCDFWIRLGPGWSYKLASLTPERWTTIEANFKEIQPLSSRGISFCVPCGTGTIYLKNAQAGP